MIILIGIIMNSENENHLGEFEELMNDVLKTKYKNPN